MASAHTKPLKRIQHSNRLRQWLDSIRGNRQTVKPEEVVRAAKDPKSAGHRHFTWDNGAAAQKYRLMEARALIRHVYIVDMEAGTKTPAYVSLKNDREQPGGGYRPTQQVLSSKALRGQLEETAKAELRSWTERYQMLTGLVSKVAAVAGIDAPKKRKPK